LLLAIKAFTFVLKVATLHNKAMKINTILALTCNVQKNSKLFTVNSAKLTNMQKIFPNAVNIGHTVLANSNTSKDRYDTTAVLSSYY
jgi:hypothetical protein